MAGNSVAMSGRLHTALVTGVVIMSLLDCQAGPHAGASKPAADTAHTGQSADFPADAKAFLLKLARASLVASVNDQPAPTPDNPPAVLREKCGCFVTLTIDGALRGCIGYLEGIKPLYEAVIDNARNAALSDTRFSPVTADEVKKIKIEVSVLTRPQPLPYTSPEDLLKKLVPGQDGIILHKGFYQSTFLPQVWEDLPDKVAFLEHLSVKGGMPRDGWKTADVKRYRAIHFQEQ